MPESINALFKQLDKAMLLEQHLLRRKLLRLKKQKKLSDKALSAIHERLSRSIELRQQRKDLVIQPEYPAELPVSDKREIIADTIREHQVVIVCGETGSGKTTQLPKICLELGLGVAGKIGHTQPRRIAARSVCSRIHGSRGTADAHAPRHVCLPGIR